MFGFGKKKREQVVYAPATGRLMPITEVGDEVFSEKMMGDGFAVDPNETAVFSPVNGTVSTVFPTKHAIGITTEKGLEVLVHIGLDTVELEGAPFTSKVKEGQEVDQNTQISEMNIEEIQKAGYDPTIVIVFTNMDLVKEVPEVASGDVVHSFEVGKLEYNK